ncbi:MAG: hypothetical protein ACI9RO_000586, partial [Alteromonas macleodii]
AYIFKRLHTIFFLQALSLVGDFPQFNHGRDVRLN